MELENLDIICEKIKQKMIEFSTCNYSKDELFIMQTIFGNLQNISDSLKILESCPKDLTSHVLAEKNDMNRFVRYEILKTMLFDENYII